MSSAEVFERFPTAKHKRIFYPIRPLFTLFVATMLGVCGLVGIFPLTFSLWMAMIIGTDDLSMVSYLRISQSIDNLRNGRKNTKSIFGLVMVTLGLIGGALLFGLVLVNLPIFATTVGSFLASSGSILIAGSLAVLGGIIARTLGVSAFLGIVLGGFLALALPITLPLVAEITFLGATAGAFTAAIITKESLRLYHWIRYGHTNADGYAWEVSQDKEPTVGDKTKATILEKTPKQIHDLRVACLKVEQAVKKSCHLGHGLTGTDTQYLCGFKDILHTLKAIESRENKAKKNLNELLEKTKELTEKKPLDSDEPKYIDTVGFSSVHLPKRLAYAKINTNLNKVNSDVSIHTLFFQQGLEAGLSKVPPALVKEFENAVHDFGI